MSFPHKSIIFIIFAMAMFLVFCAEAWAVSLSPQVVEKLRKEGRLEEWITRGKVARQQGVWQPNAHPPWLGKGSAQGDTLKPIVICVDFDDKMHTLDTSDFSLLLFSQDFVYPTGSMRDYYLENSYGKLDLVGGVTGWNRMPQDYSYYVWGQGGLGAYPHNAQRLAEDAVNAADPYVNFANYDYDGDGWVDNLIIVHAGAGAEGTGSLDDIWSHTWHLPTILIRDGVRLYTYNMGPEMAGVIGGLVHIGVFAYEFAHFLGLPDLYDDDYTSSGLGKWSMMSGGLWNNDGKTPAHFDAWCKYRLGFSEVNPLTTNQMGVKILQAETSPVSYRLWKDGIPGSQYFLVENRQKTGFDSYLPGSGLLIYHVDESMPYNSDEWCPGDSAFPHFKVALEQADGQFQLEGCYGSSNSGDAGDPFPGYWNKEAFDDTTSPSSRDYYGSSTQVAVWNVSNSDSAMYANLDVSWSRPCLFLNEFTVDDSLGGDGDGRPEGGETVKIHFTISNIWLPLTGTTVTGSVDTSGITFIDNSSYLGTIGTGDSANSYSDPMEFAVDSIFPGKPVMFTLHVVGNEGTYSLDFKKEVWVGNADILMVDDDSGSATDYQSYYTDALDSLKYVYDIWDTQGKGDPDFSFNKYKYLIWYTGDHKTDLFTRAQVESLMSFLDNGGRLFMTSQDAVEVLSSSSEPWDTLFLKQYLHVGYDGDNTKHLVAGYPGDEVGDSLYIYPEGAPGANNQTSKDNLVPDSEADTVLIYTNSQWIPADLIAGIKFHNDYFRVVLFGFGFEAIRKDLLVFQGQYLTKPHLVLRRVLDWLKIPNPAIFVISPNGGENWLTGDAHEILWQSISFEGCVKIEICCINGGDTTCSTIVDSTTNDGAYSWIVPDITSDCCWIIISDAADGVPSDASDSCFSIGRYLCGDCNSDRMVDVGDVLCKINYLFKGGPLPSPIEVCDHNGNGVIDVGDVIAEINYLFRGGHLECPWL